MEGQPVTLMCVALPPTHAEKWSAVALTLLGNQGPPGVSRAYSLRTQGLDFKISRKSSALHPYFFYSSEMMAP